MMRKLKENKGTDIPKWIGSLDAEAWVNRKRISPDGQVIPTEEMPEGEDWDKFQELRYFSMCLNRRRDRDKSWETVGWWKGHTIQEAWDGLDAMGEYVGHGRLWPGGHNIAYDWRVLDLDGYITREGWTFPKPYVTGSPFLVYTKHGEVTYNFISTTNLYNTSLKKLAPAFGMKKLGEELVMDRLDDYPDEMVEPYCDNDTAIVAKVLMDHANLIRSGDMGSFKPTIAAQSLNFWRHRFMPKDTMTIYDSRGLIQMEKAAYCGGRCEVFKLGKFEDCTQVDVHSMYPWAMQAELYPVEPLVTSPIYGDLKSMLRYHQDGNYIITDCYLDIKPGKYSPPTGVKRDDMLKFSYGHIHATIDSPAIKYILEHPKRMSIKKVNSFIPYLEAEVGFKPFIEHLFEVKESAVKDDYVYNNAKLMMNGLPGKLGQRYYGDAVEILDEAAQMLIMQMDDAGQDAISEPSGGVYYRVGDNKIMFTPARGEGMAWYSMPRIPCKVCSMGRIRLQEFMDIAGWHNYMNCDTDSLIVNEKGFENLDEAGVLGDGLGQLGIVKNKKTGRIYRNVSGTIFGNKDYVIDGEEPKCKGKKKDAEEIGPRVFMQNQFVTGLSSYWAGTRRGVRVRKVVKDMNTPYTKGIVGQSGWVEPFVLAEW